jgi:CBS domain containing-hemolysin-like protein
VRDIMVPREKVITVSLAASEEEVLETARETAHTRMPVWEGDLDNIVGIVNTKDLFHLFSLRGLVILMDAMYPPIFVEPERRVADLLRTFKREKRPMAVVCDARGLFVGIVTLEDIIEEITGDIEDEHDAIKRGVVQREDGSLICQGDVPIRDLNREFGWGLPEDVAITIAGLVLHEARRIPEVGQTYAFYGFRFEILKREGTRIAELRVMPPIDIQAG